MVRAPADREEWYGTVNTGNLWSNNTPDRFWQCQSDIAQALWLEAAQKAGPVLGLQHPWADFDTLLMLVLGEGQFGPRHWQLGPGKRLYYRLKPLIPRALVRILRQRLSPRDQQASQLQWPIEPRYAHFQWELMRQLLLGLGRECMPFVNFWPQQKRFAFVLTHDVELATGQAYVRAVADVVESFGFRSIFNFVPERYPLDYALIDELKARGFEIGVHGLTHDGKLFSSYATFHQRAARINHYLERLGAAGFRSPSTLRHPVWMQELNIQYDLSFFDTDPYEPIAGGTMSLWPFTIGKFIELPYTLIQDYALVTVLKRRSPELWLQKVDFIERYHGMALLDVHPDYLLDKRTMAVFTQFLEAMRQRADRFWHALPGEVASWWQQRSQAAQGSDLARANTGLITLTEDGIALSPAW